MRSKTLEQWLRTEEGLESDGALVVDKGVQLHRQVSSAQLLLDLLKRRREALTVALLLGHGLRLVEERLLHRVHLLLGKLLLLTMLLPLRVMLKTCLLHVSLQSLGEGKQILHSRVFLLTSCLILDGFRALELC